jgi:hypothetical protein
MSHFTLLVVDAKNQEEIEAALEPFWELDLTQADMANDSRAEFDAEIPDGELQKAYKEWQKDVPTVKQIKFAHRHHLRLKPKLTKLDCFSNDKVEPINKEEYDKWLEEQGGLSPYMVEEKINKNFYGSAQKWVNEWHHYHYVKGEGWGYYHNPNAKWDWYAIGGRWPNYFRLKEGTAGIKGKPSMMLTQEDIAKAVAEPLACDIAQKRDIDFEGMMLENSANAAGYWDDYQRELKADPKKCGSGYAYFKYGIRKEDTKETYIERRTSVSTFAVLKDGKWYQKGQMGWWAFVGDEKDKDVWDKEFAKLITEAPEDTWFALVDCHI